MKRLKELDALRGIAAMFVMLFHYSAMSEVNVLLLKIGVTGVDLFFLISGYVILMTLERTSASRDFIVSRLSRLYPSYIAMLFLTTIVIYFFDRGDTPSFREIARNLTMMQPLFKARYIDDSYWTLTVEMQFYVFMLLVYMAGKLKDIEHICTVFLFIIMVYYVVASRFFPDSKVYITPRAFFPFISHFQLFFCGILFYKMRTDGMASYRYFLLFCCFIFTLFLFDKTGRSHFFIGIVPYMIAILIYLTVFYLFIREKLKFLDIPVLTGLGSLSYCIYLFHQEAGRILYHYLVVSAGVPRFAAVGLLVALVLAVSAFVTFLIEKPLITAIRNKMVRKPGLESQPTLP